MREVLDQNQTNAISVLKYCQNSRNIMREPQSRVFVMVDSDTSDGNGTDEPRILDICLRIGR